MAREQNMQYTYRIWCAEAEKEQVEGGVNRHQEEVGGIQAVG